MAGGNDGDAPGGQRGATVQKMYHRFFSGKSPEPIQVKTTRPLPSISSTSFQAAASGGDDEMSAFPDTMPSASRAEVPPISFNRATQQAAPLNERRRKGVSIQYLASILQPRSLAELGSDATVDDLIKGILEPMARVRRLWARAASGVGVRVRCHAVGARHPLDMFPHRALLLGCACVRGDTPRLSTHPRAVRCLLLPRP